VINWLKDLNGISGNGASAEDAKVTGSMITPIAQRRIGEDKTKVRAEISAQKIACISRTNGKCNYVAERLTT